MCRPVRATTGARARTTKKTVSKNVQPTTWARALVRAPPSLPCPFVLTWFLCCSRAPPSLLVQVGTSRNFTDNTKKSNSSLNFAKNILYQIYPYFFIENWYDRVLLCGYCFCWVTPINDKIVLKICKKNCQYMTHFDRQTHSPEQTI